MVSKFLFELDVDSKEELLYELAKKLIDDEVFTSLDELHDSLMERENEISTGVGMKIAMPHLQVNNNKKDVIYYFDLLKPIDYNSIDQVPVELGFLIISNKDQNNHLEKLSKISLFLLKKENYETLLKGSKSEVKSLIKEELC